MNSLKITAQQHRGLPLEKTTEVTLYSGEEREFVSIQDVEERLGEIAFEDMANTLGFENGYYSLTIQLCNRAGYVVERDYRDSICHESDHTSEVQDVINL